MGNDVTTYTYDALDRLITAQVPGSSAAAYTYDPTGQRVRQTVGSDTTNYLWDELSAYGDVVRETNGTGTELASYTLAETQLLGQTRSGVTSYYLSDGQGSTRALLNGTGDITDTYDYTAFGEMVNQTGSTLNNYRYTGQQFDSLTGLYSLRARYYDPGVGRFVSRDTYPINYRNPIELNRYGYAANNPISRYDPTGNMSLTEFFTSTLAGHIIGGALIGGMISFISSGIFYLMADNGFCGERMKEWAEQTDPWNYLLEATLMGAATGAVIGGLPSVGRYAGQFFGFLGYGVSVYDMVTNGPNLCNGLTAVLSIGAIAGSGTIPTPILVAEDVPIVEAGVIGLNGAFTSNPAIGYQSLYGVAVGAIPADATVASIIGGIAVLFSAGGGDNDDDGNDDEGTGENPPPEREIKGVYEDGTIAYEDSVDPQFGNPRPNEWEQGRVEYRFDHENNRVYQERVFTETPDGQRVVVDIDYTNHNRPDHIAPHHHVYVENIVGRLNSGWKKLKIPSPNGRPGLPPFNGLREYLGSTE